MISHTNSNWTKNFIFNYENHLIYFDEILYKFKNFKIFGKKAIFPST